MRREAKIQAYYLYHKDLPWTCWVITAPKALGLLSPPFNDSPACGDSAVLGCRGPTGRQLGRTFHGAGLIFCMNHMGSGFGVHFLGTYLSLSRADPTETWKFCQILFPFSRVTHQAGSWEALFLKQYALLQLHLATLCCQPGV